MTTALSVKNSSAAFFLSVTNYKKLNIFLLQTVLLCLKNHVSLAFLKVRFYYVLSFRIAKQLRTITLLELQSYGRKGLDEQLE